MGERLCPVSASQLCSHNKERADVGKGAQGEESQLKFPRAAPLPHSWPARARLPRLRIAPAPVPSAGSEKSDR